MNLPANFTPLRFPIPATLHLDVKKIEKLAKNLKHDINLLFESMSSRKKNSCRCTQCKEKHDQKCLHF